MIAKDKQGHIIAGIVISLIVGILFMPVAGFAAAVLAGVAKEVYDSRHPTKHTADVMDAVATAAGGLIAMALLLCL